MITVTQEIHTLAGQPEPVKNKGIRQMRDNEVCLVCGAHYSQCVPDKTGISNTDTDRDRFLAPWSGVVCIACAWCSQGRPPDTVRMWSILYRQDGEINNPGLFRDYITAKQEASEASYGVATLLDIESYVALVNRADISCIVRTLVDPPDTPWTACVADSGQIHLLRFAQLNVGRMWTIIFEREQIEGDSDTFSEVLWHVASLRAAGFHTEDIATLSPHPRQLLREPLAWCTHAVDLLLQRPDLRDLALFFCTKDWTDEYRYLAEKAVRAERRDDAHARGRELAAMLPGFHPPREEGPEEVLGLGSEGGGTRWTQGALF